MSGPKLQNGILLGVIQGQNERDAIKEQTLK
jgi:hypothetical protein